LIGHEGEVVLDGTTPDLSSPQSAMRASIGKPRSLERNWAFHPTIHRSLSKHCLVAISKRSSLVDGSPQSANCSSAKTPRLVSMSERSQKSIPCSIERSMKESASWSSRPTSKKSRRSAIARSFLVKAPLSTNSLERA